LSAELTKKKRTPSDCFVGDFVHGAVSSR